MDKSYQAFTAVGQNGHDASSMENVKHAFDEKHVLHELKHYLPSQTPLRDFIHHNTLHGFQQMKFYDAIFKASKIFGYQVTLQLTEYRELYNNGRIKNDILEKIIADKKGKENVSLWKDLLIQKKYDASNSPRIGSLRAHWKSVYKTDLDSQVQPLLFRILSSYLDQGISIWNFPVEPEGFLASIRELEKQSFVSFFKSRRARLLLSRDCKLTDLLNILVGDPRYYPQ